MDGREARVPDLPGAVAGAMSDGVVWCGFVWCGCSDSTCVKIRNNKNNEHLRVVTACACAVFHVNISRP